MKIEILGPGCPNCQQLEKNVKNVAEEFDSLNVEITKIEDTSEIASRGVMNTPALAVDGEVKISGRVPSEEEIKELMK